MLVVRVHVKVKPESVETFKQATITNATHSIEPAFISAHVEGDASVLATNEFWETRWRAMVDGEPAETVRVNGSFVGAIVPSGSHEVSFRRCADPPGPRFSGAPAPRPSRSEVDVVGTGRT